MKGLIKKIENLQLDFSSMNQQYEVGYNNALAKCIDLLKEAETSDKPALNIGNVSNCSHDFVPHKVWMHECLKCGIKHYERPNCC